MHTISERVWATLVCPSCCSPLRPQAGGADCTQCGLHYPAAANGQLDLRLQRPKPETVKFTLGGAPVPAGFDFEPLRPSPSPALDLAALDIPWHLTRTLINPARARRSTLPHWIFPGISLVP